MAKHPQSVMIGVSVIVAILIIVAIYLAVKPGNNADDATAWATINSQQLHTFMQDCKSNGGNPDVRPTPQPSSPPQITFVCLYPDREVDYQLIPGNK